MVTTSLLLIGLFFQAVLAAFVYQDAYSRGDDEGLWVVMTLLLGIFGVLMYLLSRPDEKIPEDERTHSASSIVLKGLGIYLVSIVGGLLVGLIAVLGIDNVVELPQPLMAVLNHAVLLVFLILSPLTLYAFRNIERVNNLLPDRRVS